MAANKDASNLNSGVGRRRVPRRAVNSNIGILASGQYVISSAVEIGEGGMMIESECELQAEQMVVATIRIPGVIQTSLMCKVLYVLQACQEHPRPRYGLQFLNIEFDHKRKIRNFVASGIDKSQFAKAS